jgi:hypothetical protein
VLYATGYALATAHHGWRLLLSYRRRVTAGQYTLTLRTSHGPRRIVQRTRITIT